MAAWQWVFAFVPQDPFMVKGPMPSTMPPPPPGALTGQPPPGFSTPLTPSTPVSTEPMKGDDDTPKKRSGSASGEIPNPVGHVKEIKTDPPLVAKAEPTKPPMAPGFLHGPAFPAPPPYWPGKGKGKGKEKPEIMEGGARTCSCSEACSSSAKMQAD